MTTLAPTQRLTLEATELDRREGGGERVRLLWMPERNELLTEVLNIHSKVATLFRAPNEKALDSYNHPYSYPEATPNYDYKVVAGEIEIPRIRS